MSVVMSALNRNHTKIAEYQDAINTAMKNIKLPDDLQIKISDFFLSSHNKLSK